MGNQVVVAIPFKNFDKLRKTKIIDILDMAMHGVDINIVKNIKSGSFPQQFAQVSAESKDMLCSHYYHANDNVSLYIDCDNMTYFPAYKEKIYEADDKVKSLIKNYRFNKKELSVTGSLRKLTPFEESKEKYFVFGFLTDLFDSLTDDQFYNMLDYAKTMESIDDNESFEASSIVHSKYGLNFENFNIGNFIPMAVLKSNQFCVATMSGNKFSITAFRKHCYVNPTTVEIKELDKKGFFPDKNGVASAFLRTVIESLGFNVKLK